MRAVSADAFGSHVPSYADVLALDRRLREFPVPPELALEYGDAAVREARESPERILMRWCVLQMRESGGFLCCCVVLIVLC